MKGKNPRISFGAAVVESGTSELGAYCRNGNLGLQKKKKIR
jgi:hypothetical protein